MGKNVPLRIGRKTKRELNPVEKMRRKEKHKKNLKQFLKKINQKAAGEFKSKIKQRRSPSPESNDPMLGDLISSSKLRMRDLPSAPEAELEDGLIETEAVKVKSTSLVPAVVNKKQERLESESEESSGSDSEIITYKPASQKTMKVKQNQGIYKTMLESDSKLTDFFDNIRDLL